MTEKTTNEISTPAVITVPGATTDVDLNTVDLGLPEDSIPVKPILEEVWLMWYNGLPTTDGRLAIGWHVKAGINPYLDETCQALVAQGLVERYLVQHRQPDRNGNNDPKLEWHLKACSLVILADGALSPLQMNKSIERVGVAWGWGPEYDSQNKPKLNKKGEQSRKTTLKMRVYVHELYVNGFYSWLPLTLNGEITDDMLQALYEQYKVLEAYSAYRRASALNPAATFYTFSLPLVPSGQTRMVGEAPNQSPIYPMRAALPDVIGVDYLKAHLVPKLLFNELRDELVPEAVNWSVEESARIVTYGNADVSALNGSGAVPQIAANSSLSQGDPLALPAQYVGWIREHYCHNNAAVVTALCERFGVTELSQLSRSQYQQLVVEFNKAASQEQ
jgi:hypothetical protein